MSGPGLDAVAAAAVAALRDGLPVLLPTDTVYGLAVDAFHEEPVRELARLKGRPEGMPVALVAASVDAIVDAVPELRDRAGEISAVLPGPFTLVLANPAGRLPWLAGRRPDTIGIRVPVLPPEAAAVVAAVGAVAATSANLHGGADPASPDDVDERLRAACAAEVDAGLLPGTPSTVVDLTGPEPVVLREGAVPAAETLERLGAVS